jgi:excinuclease UvrABC nuclease subunit
MRSTINVKTKYNSYTYQVYGLNEDWSDVPVNYMFVTSNGKILYAGQTNSMKNRMSNHPQLDKAIRLGATKILARINRDEASRLIEEKNIVGWFQPTLNTLLK